MAGIGVEQKSSRYPSPFQCVSNSYVADLEAKMKADVICSIGAVTVIFDVTEYALNSLQRSVPTTTTAHRYLVA